MRFDVLFGRAMRCVPQNPPRAASSGLTMLQFGGAFCIDPEQPRHLHQFKSKAPIASQR
jgi:hypothetical protein